MSAAAHDETAPTPAADGQPDTGPLPGLPTPGQPLTDDHLYQLAEHALDAALSSADVDTIGAMNWWDRAKTALATAAAASTSWEQCSARLGRKLQISSYRRDAAITHTAIGQHLADPSAFARWRRLTHRDALYITAAVRALRTARRDDHAADQKAKAKPAAKAKPKPAPADSGQASLI